MGMRARARARVHVWVHVRAHVRARVHLRAVTLELRVVPSGIKKCWKSILDSIRIVLANYEPMASRRDAFYDMFDVLIPKILAAR